MTDEMEVDAAARAAYLEYVDAFGYPNGLATWDELPLAFPDRDGLHHPEGQETWRNVARRALEAVRALRPAGEPVAWMGYWPGAGSVDSHTAITRNRRDAERWKADGAEVTPLAVASPIIDSKVAGPVVKAQHEWEKSPLGHGVSICKHCRMTLMEASVLGMECEAAPGTTPTAANATERDGWIEWKGGECPVPFDGLVYYRMRQSERGSVCGPATAGGLDWQHGTNDIAWNDIIAYRLAASPDTEEVGRG